jgi:hypothetical protein
MEKTFTCALGVVNASIIGVNIQTVSIPGGEIVGRTEHLDSARLV